MNTVNISLTKDQVELVDKLIRKYRFANRSEFFRAILRKVTSEFTISEQVAN